LNFFTFDNYDSYTISPTSTTPTGSISITVTVSDGNMESTSIFIVKIMSKPIFDDGTTSFPDMNVKVNVGGIFTIPAFNDPDGDIA
jgi:hypothetical protein